MVTELHIIGFKVGRETYGVPITSLHEIVRVPEVTSVPDAPDYMEGVINLRGRIVSVLDLRKRLGDANPGRERRNRILVVQHKGKLSGLVVDSASEVLKIPTSEIEPSPTESLEGGIKCVTGLGKHKGRLIVLLDLAKLLEASTAPRPNENARDQQANGGTRTAAASGNAGR